DRAMDLDGRQRQFFSDLAVLEGSRLVQGLALDPLGHQGAGGNGRAATVGLEPGILDHAVLRDHLDMQLHHVTAGRCTDHAGTNGFVALVKGADIAGILVVVNDFFRIGHGCSPSDTQWAAHWMVDRSIPSLYISHRGESSRSLATFSRIVP